MQTINSKEAISLHDAGKLLGKTGGSTYQYAVRHGLRRGKQLANGKMHTVLQRQEVQQHADKLRGVHRPDPATIAGGSKSKQAVLEVVGNEPVRQAQLISAITDLTGLAAPTIREAIERLVDAGHIRRTETKDEKGIKAVYLVSATSPAGESATTGGGATALPKAAVPVKEPADDDMVTSIEAAAMLGKSRSSFSAYAIKHGLFRQYGNGGGELARYRRKEIEAHVGVRFARGRAVGGKDIKGEMMTASEAARNYGLSIETVLGLAAEAGLDCIKSRNPALNAYKRTLLEEILASQPDAERVTAQNAASALGVSVGTFYNMANQAKLDYRKGARREENSYFKIDIDKLLAERGKPRPAEALANIQKPAMSAARLGTNEGARMLGVAPGTFARLAAEANIDCLPGSGRRQNSYPLAAVEELAARRAANTLSGDYIDTATAAEICGVSKAVFLRLAEDNGLDCQHGAGRQANSYRRCDIEALRDLQASTGATDSRPEQPQAAAVHQAVPAALPAAAQPPLAESLAGVVRVSLGTAGGSMANYIDEAPVLQLLAQADVIIAALRAELACSPPAPTIALAPAEALATAQVGAVSVSKGADGIVRTQLELVADLFNAINSGEVLTISRANS